MESVSIPFVSRDKTSLSGDPNLIKPLCKKYGGSGEISGGHIMEMGIKCSIPRENFEDFVEEVEMLKNMAMFIRARKTKTDPYQKMLNKKERIMDFKMKELMDNLSDTAKRHKKKKRKKRRFSKSKRIKFSKKKRRKRKRKFSKKKRKRKRKSK
jgi:hypothetical protein